jgi:hypothetical protein
MTFEELDKLINAYAWRVVDDMDLKDLCAFAADVIAHDFKTETEEYVIETIKNYYPDLLND